MEKIVFIHIPKTAGTTFSSILHGKYGIEKRFLITAGSVIPSSYHYDATSLLSTTLPETFINKVSLVYGHFPFTEKFVDFKYITFLREPVSRVISDYNYLNTTPSHPLFNLVNDLSLRELVSQHTTLMLDNLQTRMILGKMKGEIDEFDLELAKKYLIEKFAFVGITEEFDKSINLLFNTLNLGEIPFYNSENITSKKKVTSNEDIKLIQEYNEFDIKLYNFYSDIFKEKTKNISFPTLEKQKTKKNVIKKFILKFFNILGYNVSISKK